MIYTKQYTGRTLYGLTARETFELELECLQRIKGCSNVGQLIDYNSKDMTLTLEFAGQCYDRVKATTLPIGKDDFIDQWNVAMDVFKAKNIVHLDLMVKNLCITDGKLTIIDFGIAIVDGNPKSKLIEERYSNFLSNGGWSTYSQRQLSIIICEFNNMKLLWQ